MKIAPLIIGAINAQSGDDADRWDAADFTFNADTFNYADASSGGKWTATPLTVAAVTCWESNNMGDLNHYVTSSDDGHGWNNPHYGHGPDNGVAQVGSYYQNSDGYAATNSLDMHSALAYDNRLSGCIYEASGWSYSADTFDHTFKVEYGLDNTGANTASGNDASTSLATGGTTVRPVWWHYFNAHLIPGKSTYNNNAKHLIVMANPSYEGLGYLNFIVTYGTYVAGGDYFGDRDENANTRGINDDFYSSGNAFVITQGDVNAVANDNLGQWYSVYGGTDAWTTEMAAVSSFPHNDLGKDFRFNVRILHKGGAGDPTATGVKDSYYWYKVDEIKIQFPDVVRCPREMKNIANGTAGYGDVKGSGTVAHETATDTFRCMDSANYNGHRGWNSAVAKNNRNSNWDDTNAREDIDKPWYLENLGADHSFTGTAYAGQNVDGTNLDTDSGFICGPAALADGEWFKCGTHYTVKGLMNTYDEFAQQEYGTMQEFWFQFHYHYVFRYDSGDDRNSDFNRDSVVDAGETDVTGSTYANGSTGYDHRHNFPNILFNAFDVVNVSMFCDAAASETRLNSNACV